jgi:hypothetical protein
LLFDFRGFVSKNENMCVCPSLSPHEEELAIRSVNVKTLIYESCLYEVCELLEIVQYYCTKYILLRLSYYFLSLLIEQLSDELVALY